MEQEEEHAEEKVSRAGQKKAKKVEEKTIKRAEGKAKKGSNSCYAFTKRRNLPGIVHTIEESCLATSDGG